MLRERVFPRGVATVKTAGAGVGDPEATGAGGEGRRVGRVGRAAPRGGEQAGQAVAARPVSLLAVRAKVAASRPVVAGGLAAEPRAALARAPGQRARAVAVAGRGERGGRARAAVRVAQLAGRQARGPGPG